MSKLAMMVKTKCQPGKREEVRDLWEEYLKPRLEANDSQEVYFYSYDLQDENTFYLFELYSNQEAFEANSKAPWFWEYMKMVGPLLDGEPEVSMANPVWAKGVTL